MAIRHPEQRPGEIYLGNTTKSAFNASSWTTKRMGLIARRADGCEISGGGCFGEKLHPWFIAKSEVERVIDSEKRAGNSWSAGKIADLQPMLEDDFTI